MARTKYADDGAKYMQWGDKKIADMNDEELVKAVDHFRKNVQMYRSNVAEAKKRFGDAWEPSGVLQNYYEKFMGAFRAEIRRRQEARRQKVSA